MSIVKQIKNKFNTNFKENEIIGTLGFFDRMIFNGYLRGISTVKGFSWYLSQSNVLLKDFKDYTENQTKSIVLHLKDVLAKNDVELQYLDSSNVDKDNLARKEFEKKNYKTGVIAAFATLEPCRTFKVVKNHELKKLMLKATKTKCKKIYIYINDEEFGWMFVKIQTWFPFDVQIYINGREYLSKIFDKNKLKYEMYNNSFSYIDNFEKAQNIANDLLNKKISDSFDGIIKKFNNLLPDIEKITGNSYYWCIDQCEYAYDITFKKQADLDDQAVTLFEQAFFALGCENIYSFFGRNIKDIQRVKKSEITSDVKHWYQGYRVKFKFNKNQVKMYNKSNNLRIEVTINNPRDFKVLKSTQSFDDRGNIYYNDRWVPMSKSIANLYRYAEISKDIIKRTIDALPKIDTSSATLKEIEEISCGTFKKNRKYSGFNILDKKTLSLFKIISNGDKLIHGFDNKTIRLELYEGKKITQKEISRTTRDLSKLKAHGLIKKVPHSNRYYVSVKGRRILTSINIYTRRDLLSN